VRTTLPPELAVHAVDLEQLARARLRRGRYALVIRLVGYSSPGVGIDVGRAKALYLGFRALRDELAPGTDLPLSIIAGAPDLYRGAVQVDPEQARVALREALDSALCSLDAMRAAEGAALGRELGSHLLEARRLCAVMADSAHLLVDGCRRRLRERVAQLLHDGGLGVDPGRLELEVALFAERSDVSEELARLDSHFAQFEQLFASPEPVGRTLDFLLQEMAREANTIGSKSQDAALAHRVVELKAWIERMREQIQNVE
jgi:uncharacterized protein (TIGR00255 family)